MATEGEAPPNAAEAEERQQLRPYRRLVGLLFALAIAVLSVLILRSIIRRLDRLPSVEALARPSHVDLRALRACNEDLERLETRVLAVSKVFGQLPAEEQVPPTWDGLSRELEVERVAIIARCRLEEPSEDPAVHELATAAQEIEATLRAYGLLYDRHLQDGVPHALEVRAALRRAAAALSAR